MCLWKEKGSCLELGAGIYLCQLMMVDVFLRDSPDTSVYGEPCKKSAVALVQRYGA